MWLYNETHYLTIEQFWSWALSVPVRFIEPPSRQVFSPSYMCTATQILTHPFRKMECKQCKRQGRYICTGCEPNCWLVSRHRHEYLRDDLLERLVLSAFYVQKDPPAKLTKRAMGMDTECNLCLAFRCVLVAGILRSERSVFAYNAKIRNREKH